MLVEYPGRFAVVRGKKRSEPPADPLGKVLYDIRVNLGTMRGKGVVGIYEMKAVAKDLGIKGEPIDGTLWSRIESGEKRPGPKSLLQLRRLAIKAGIPPRHLFYRWLEAQGLGEFVDEMERGREEKER